MTFERKVDIDGETVLLKFRNFTDVPAGISRRLTFNSEAQMWESLAWGLIEPTQWPPLKDGEEPKQPAKHYLSTAIRDGLMDWIPARVADDIYKEWIEYSKVSPEE